MKKILAAIVCTLMMTTVFTACGEKSDDSKAKDKDVFSAIDISKIDFSLDEVDGEKVEDSAKRGEAFMQSGANGKYTIEGEMGSSLFGDTKIPIKIVAEGGKSYMEMSMLGASQNIIVKDGKSYTLDSTSKTYTVAEATSNDSFLPTDGIEGLKYVDTYKVKFGENELTREKYSLSLEEEGLNVSSNYTLYYAGDQLAKIVIEADAVIMKVDMEIIVKKISNDADSSLFEIPADYTETDIDEEGLDDAELTIDNVELALGALGITEDDLIAKGHTFESFVELSEEEQGLVIIELMGSSEE